jgi:hypothetical protein
MKCIFSGETERGAACPMVKAHRNKTIVTIKILDFRNKIPPD